MDKMDYFEEEINKIFKLYFNDNFKLELIKQSKHCYYFLFIEKFLNATYFHITFRMNDNDIELNDFLLTHETIKINFDNTHKYFKNWYKNFSGYEYIIELPNFNNEQFNEVIEKYIKEQQDYNIFKDETFIKRLDNNMVAKYNHIINAAKFNLI